MSRAIQEAAAQGGSLTDLCQTAGISRGLAAPEPIAADTALREHIQRVALECSCYGYRRITKELHRQGIRRTVSVCCGSCERTTCCGCQKKVRGDHALLVYPNLAAEMDVTAPDQLWVSDLTYIRLGHEFIYLAVVLDVCSRRCLGWSLGRHLDAALATSALRMALKERKPQAHHSDRGSSMLRASIRDC